jgi:sugar/nucleoside kinase (ribokinase family)
VPSLTEGLTRANTSGAVGSSLQRAGSDSSPDLVAAEQPDRSTVAISASWRSLIQSAPGPGPRGSASLPAMSTVLACGVAVLDVQQTVERLPGPDEKLVAHDLLVASGGPAANAAVTAAALGVDARLVTRIGASPLGTLISADLAAHGVDVVDRAGPRQQPAVSTVLVTRGTGQRAVVSVNASRGTPPRAGDKDTADWAPAVVQGIDALLVDGHHLDLAVPLAAAARAVGVPVLLDGGSWKPGLERLLSLVDVAVISAVLRVPADLAGGPGSPADDVLAAVSALGPPVVARSRGYLPLEVLTGAGRAEVPVPQVEVVDTLGAGDVLHGALLAWLAVRGTFGLADGLAWAARVAAASCTAAGARGWLADGDRLARHRRDLAPGPPPQRPSG